MLKAAVIGLGNMGQYHAKAYSLIEEASLVAVCDPNQDRFDHIIKESHTRYYSDLLDLLSNEAIDVVSVCVPTSKHHDVAKACINKGIHVLVEKPIAQTVEEAQALVAYAKANQVKLTVGHIERFNPAVIKTKQLIQQQALGDVRSIIAKRYGPFPKQIKDANVLVDVAVHDIDIVQYLVDQPLAQSKITTQKIHCQDRADYGHLQLTYGANTDVNIFVSWAVPFKKRVIEIIGTKAVAMVDCISQSVTLYPVSLQQSGYDMSMPVSEPNPIEIQKKEPIVAQCLSFVQAIKNQKDPMVCPEQATQALDLALQSAQGVPAN